MSKMLDRICERSMRGSVYLSVEACLHGDISNGCSWIGEIAEEFLVDRSEVETVIRQIAGEMGRRGMKAKHGTDWNRKGRS